MEESKRKYISDAIERFNVSIPSTEEELNMQTIKDLEKLIQAITQESNTLNQYINQLNFLIENDIRETEKLKEINLQKEKELSDLNQELKTKINDNNVDIIDFKKDLDKNVAELSKGKQVCLDLEKQIQTQKQLYQEKNRELKTIESKINISSLSFIEKQKTKEQIQNEIEQSIKQYELNLKEQEEKKKIDISNIEHLRMLHNIYLEAKGNIRVFCRVRPPLQSESRAERTKIDFPDENTIILHGPLQKSNIGKAKENRVTEVYKFDRVFSPKETQDDIFEEISQLVQSALDGYNVCIFAYGQTGSGKTYTMEGNFGNKRGIIPRSVEKIFDFKKHFENMGWRFDISVSCSEIYLDQKRDLLDKSSNTGLDKGNKLKKIKLSTINDWDTVHESAYKKRIFAETMCNEKSSRSHCIFQIFINGNNVHDGSQRKGTLNLVDLAGNERISQSKVEGQRKKEAISINKSLSALKGVITALVSISKGNKELYIPYKDSVLTTQLQSYLGGDSKTLMFVNISPILSNFSESISSLKFAAEVNCCYSHQI